MYIVGIFRNALFVNDKLNNSQFEIHKCSYIKSFRFSSHNVILILRLKKCKIFSK